MTHGINIEKANSSSDVNDQVEKVKKKTKQNKTN